MLCLENYLDRICTGLNLPDEELKAIREEIECHIRDAVASKALEQATEEQRLAAALKDVGDPLVLRAHYRSAFLKQHLMRVISRLAGMGILVWLFFYSFAFINASMKGYFNLSAFLLAPLGATVLLLGTFGIGELGQALTAPFRLSLNSSALNWTLVGNLYRTWAVYMLGCGIFAAALGAYLSCHLLDRSLPVGPGLALAMMGLIYGTILSGVLWSFALSLPGDGSAQAKRKNHRFRTLWVMVVFLGIVAIAWNQVFPYHFSLARLIFLPAILFMLIGATALSLATFGFKGCLKALNDPKKLRILGIYSVIIGLAGFVNHVVLCLFTEVSMEKMHMGVATGLLLLLYGIFSGIVCWVLAGPLAPKINAPGSEPIQA